MRPAARRLLIGGICWLALPGAVARPVAAQSAIDAACQADGWRQVGLGQGQARASVYQLSASRDRLLAAAHVGQGSNGTWQVYGGALDAEGLSLLSTLEGQRVTDLLSTPAHRDTSAWASGFGDSNVFGALAASPTGFAPRGSLTAWPARLMSTGLEVFALATKPGANPGVYRWDASLAPAGDWVLSSGDVVDAAGQPVRAAWASATDSGGRMWLGTDRAGLWTSADGGLWERRGSSGTLDLAFATITAISPSPSSATKLAIGLGPSAVQPPKPGANSSRGVLVSRDGGFSFGAATYPGLLAELSDQVTDLAFSPSQPELLFATVWGDGLWASHDGGVTWLHLGLDGQGADASAAYLAAMELVQPALHPGCELLFIGGDNGLWVRDVAGLGRGARIYLPWLNRGNTQAGAATAGGLAPPLLGRQLPSAGR